MQRNTAVDTLNCATCGVTMNCTVDDTRKSTAVSPSTQSISAARTADLCALWWSRGEGIGAASHTTSARVLYLPVP